MSPNNTDMLSTLPEEITSHILSLMPTKFAVRTSVLSRKWRYSWTTVTNLVFDDQSMRSSDNFPKFVYRVLKFCGSPQIHLFRLCLRSYASNSDLLNWIDKAVRLNVCELDIQAYKFELPLNLLTCKTLTKLRLYHRSPAYGRLWVPSCQLFNLPCLKTLHIIVYTICHVNAFKLINGCPILETLSLKVYYLEDEEDYIFNISTLKRLKFTVETASVINKVVLHVPILEYLSVGGILCSRFVMENVPTSIETSLSFYSFKTISLWIGLLRGLNGAKSLSAKNSTFTFSVSTSARMQKLLASPLPIFQNMNTLELNGYCHIKLVSLFLESSPKLQHICVGKAFSLDHQYELRSWIEPKLVPACMITTLTSIKLCDAEKSDMKFLEYMLGNAQVLQTVTISWGKGLCIEEKTWLGVKVISFSRASTHLFDFKEKGGKKVNHEFGDIDRLSTLPEEITSCILSLMLTKFADRTSILLRRWRYSWTTVTNLDFEDLHPDDILFDIFPDFYVTNTEIDNFTKFVDRVLESCSNQRFTYSDGTCYTVVLQSQVC